MAGRSRDRMQQQLATLDRRLSDLSHVGTLKVMAARQQKARNERAMLQTRDGQLRVYCEMLVVIIGILDEERRVLRQQSSVISHQSSAISHQSSAISHQPSPISNQQR